MIEVRRDGNTLETFNTGDETNDRNAAWKWILKHQAQSVDWAMRYEGYEIYPPETEEYAAQQRARYMS